MLALLCSFLPIIAVASTVDSGTCGDNLTWMLNDRGLLTISGTGEMDSYYSESNVPWYDYRSRIKSVTIQDGVTNIGDYAFSSCENLNSISLADSITDIGECPFIDCKNLNNITIENNSATYSLENGILFNKEKTKLILAPRNISGEYTMPYGVDTVSSSAFDCCYKLTKINFPYKMKYIESTAFSDCTGLTSLEIPFEEGAFIENSDRSGGKNFPTYIERYAFGGCTNLKKVSILIDCSYYSSLGYFHIRNYAFGDCTSLKKVYLPVSTVVERNSFNDCTSLRDIYYEGTNTSSGHVDSDYFENCKIHYGFASSGEVNGNNYVVSGHTNTNRKGTVTVYAEKNEATQGSQTIL